LFCLWLVLPIFNGVTYIYENLVRKYVKVGGHVSKNSPKGQRRVLQMMILDARKPVERYIKKYGLEEFDRFVKADEKEARKH
ncbi:hva22-like protein f, partial [Phtheirospermum japonicum]